MEIVVTFQQLEDVLAIVGHIVQYHYHCDHETPRDSDRRIRVVLEISMRSQRQATGYRVSFSVPKASERSAKGRAATMMG
jgi:hypothetical protein